MKCMKQWILAFFLMLSAVLPAMASDHADYVSGDYASPGAVTRDCMGCHADQVTDFMESAHWLWKGPTPFLIGHENDTHLGKINLMNNF